jgi:hypothetical protein
MSWKPISALTVGRPKQVMTVRQTAVGRGPQGYEAGGGGARQDLAVLAHDLLDGQVNLEVNALGLGPDVHLVHLFRAEALRRHLGQEVDRLVVVVRDRQARVHAALGHLLLHLPLDHVDVLLNLLCRIRLDLLVVQREPLLP